MIVTMIKRLVLFCHSSESCLKLPTVVYEIRLCTLIMALDDGCRSILVPGSTGTTGKARFHELRISSLPPPGKAKFLELQIISFRDVPGTNFLPGTEYRVLRRFFTGSGYRVPGI